MTLDLNNPYLASALIANIEQLKVLLTKALEQRDQARAAARKAENEVHQLTAGLYELKEALLEGFGED